MNIRTKATCAIASLVTLIGGCAAASHVKPLQPPAAPKSAKPAIPDYRPAMQLGIDIDAYTYRGQNVARAAGEDVRYIASLHANAVSISFPFFMSGPLSSAPHATASTPTPAQLSTIIMAAEKAGLYVSIRPLLDERSLGMSRVGWRPADARAWFSNYAQFLRPYAAMAQADHVQEFFDGVEFTDFAHSPYWNTVAATIKHAYKGTVAFANNWDSAGLAGGGGKGVTETMDAYHPIRGSRLLAGWERYDRQMPSGIAETEVGIDAIAGADAKPAKHEWQHATVLDPAIQARWFTAACRAAKVTHLGGIYFWSIGLGKPSPPTLRDQGAWAESAGAGAIQKCFAAEVPS